MGAFSRGTRAVARSGEKKMKKKKQKTIVLASKRASERTRSRFRKLEKIVADMRGRGAGRKGGGEERREMALVASCLPRSWMKTVRGIFLTTRGHPGTVVSKDCASQMKGTEGRENGKTIPLLRSCLRSRHSSVYCVAVFHDDDVFLVVFSAVLTLPSTKTECERRTPCRRRRVIH